MTEPERPTGEAWEAEMYRLLAENVLDYAIFVIGPDRHVLTWTRGAERLLGYAEAEVVGRPCDTFFTPEDRDAGVPQWELDQAVATGRGDDDRWHVRKDGSRFWSSGVATPLRDAGGSLRGFAKIMRDRTDHQLAQERLVAQAQLLDLAPDAILVRDTGDRITYWNRGAAERYGWSAGEALGQVAHTLLGTRFPEPLPDIRATLDREGHWEGELTHTCRGGREVVVSSRWAMRRDGRGGTAAVMEINTDITARKRAEERLARDSLLLASVGDAVTVTDLDGVVTYWNEGSARLFGWAADETVGRPLADRVPDAGRAAMTAAFLAIRDGREFTGEWEDYRKDGSRVWVDARVGLIRDPEGRPTGVLGVARDISERKRLEGRAREAERLEAVGRLAGGVGHEFNNLLTVIRGYAQVLLGERDESDPSRAFLAEIDRAATRAADLTRQLLAFSGRQIVQPRVVDLNAAVAGLVDTLRGMIGAGVTLVLDLASDLGRVAIDPAQVEEVVTALAANGRDAMPGGGTLTVATRAAVAGRYAVLAVTDTGPEVPPDVLARVFEPFPATGEPGAGTGLGLAAVYGIARQAGGHAEAESGAGRGSTFRVYLPALPALPSDRPAGAPAPGATTASGGGTMVLLAEDNEGVRGLARHLLRTLGHAVLEAGSGEEALAVAAAHPGRIDLLVTDVVMPGLPGPDLAAQVAAVRPGLRVLYLSGYAPDAIFRHGILEPGANFLQKPFTQVGFVQKVREVLAGRG